MGEAIGIARSAEESLSVGSRELRTAMGHFATGVTVVTSADPDGAPFGSTANAVSSLSLDPPLLLVCLRRESETLARLRSRGCFAVNVLADEQLSLAARFAKQSDADTWSGVARREGAGGIPLLEDAVAVLECAVHEIAEGGDHEIVIGRVLRVEHPEEHVPPLLFYRGRFARMLDPESQPEPEPDPPEPAAARPVPEAATLDELPDVFVPTPDGEMRLLAVDQLDRPATSAIALIGEPRRSRGALVYLHRGCFLGDALGHLECHSAQSLRLALRRIHAEGTGVVVYHRDDSSPFAGCCVDSAPPAPVAAGEREALAALRASLQALGLRRARLLTPAPGATTLPAGELGLEISMTESIEQEDRAAA